MLVSLMVYIYIYVIYNMCYHIGCDHWLTSGPNFPASAPWKLRDLLDEYPSARRSWDDLVEEEAAPKNMGIEEKGMFPDVFF